MNSPYPVSALIFVSLLVAAESIFQLENSVDDKLFISPLARHRLQDFEHYVYFIIHDVSSFFCVSIFLYLWRIGRTNPNHKFVGRLFVIPLTLSVISGFCLCSRRSGDSKFSPAASSLFSITLGSQGWNIISISLNAFAPKGWISKNNFTLLLCILHIYDFYLGLKSLGLLLSLICRTTGTESDSSLVETSSDLLMIMTIPQLINEAIFIWIHYWNRKANYATFSWIDHHNMSVFFLIIMCLPGVFFSFAHDKYWVFYSGGIQTPFLRAVVMVSPMAAMVYYNLPMILKSVHSHFEKAC